jgi:predicted amidohydrolase YtcJ
LLRWSVTPHAPSICAAIRTVTSCTIWSAAQLFLKDMVGSLEVGKYADLVVWNIAPHSADPAAIKEMRALMTTLEGEIVYRRDEF